MGIKLNSYKFALPFLLLGLANPADAAEATPQAPLQPFTLNGRYTIAWSGIPLGRIILSANETDTTYSMVIDTKTKGIGALISDDKREIAANGTKSADGNYIPARYESKPQKGDGDNNVTTLTYDALGNIASRFRTKDDDPAWRPAVPNAEINSARDPVTAAFILRNQLHAALSEPKAKVSTRTYDGMRLAEMSLERSENSKLTIINKETEIVNVVVKRAPINGYTPKELKKYEKGDPEIRIYFSNDAAFIPVRASAKTMLGELSMTLSELKSVE